MEIRTIDRIIFALDFNNRHQADLFLDKIDIGAVKIGLQLFMAEGQVYVKELIKRGYAVMLDLKLHDIPTTVKLAAKQASDMGVDCITVHVSGGLEMLEAALEGINGRTDVIGVSVLTSLDQKKLEQVGVKSPISEQVSRLAGLARIANLGGMVCSPQEITYVRQSFPEALIFCPGIRGSRDAINDQRRTSSAKEAMIQGADALIVGRPIRDAPNPQQAINDLLAEMVEIVPQESKSP